MRSLIVILFLWTTTVLASDLSFQQAVEQMMRQNPALAQRTLNTEASRNEWSRSKASYLPQLDFSQTWTRSNNPVYVFGSLLNQQQFTEANFSIDSLNHPDPLTDISSQFQLGWLIYDFGRRENQIGSAEGGYRIASLQEKSFRLSLLQELVRRYYVVSLTRQQLAVAQDALETAESRLEQARNRVAQGLVVQSDELSAEVYRAQRVQEKIDSENQIQFAIAALSELLGEQQDQNLITAELNPAEFPQISLAEWEIQMRQNRPELMIVAESLGVAEKEVAIQRSAFLPSLQAWSNYQWHGTSLSYSGDNWGAGFELKWNLFHGFSDSRKYSAAKLQEKAAREKQREAENGLLLQLKKAYLDYRSAREKLTVASAAVAQAAESKRIYADRYASGMVTIQDSLQADTAYNQTRLMYFRDLYDTYVSYASLLAAAGKEEEIKTVGVQ